MQRNKVVIVEDEMIVARDIAYYLKEIGCEVLKIFIEGEDAVEFVNQNQVDILLMDITLKGKINGVETVQKINENKDIPVIYLTANTDSISFQLAKTTKPFGFIEKPFKPKRLQRTVALLIEQINDDNKAKAEEDTSKILDDRIFVRDSGKMKKIDLDDILLIEADGSYAKIMTMDKEYLLAMNLLKIESKISHKSFMRVHRSYLINLNHVEGIHGGYVDIESYTIPIGKKYLADFMKAIKVI